MLIRRIRLNDFRNYRALDLRMPEGLTLLVGENAQGKTNLLEAIYLCCMGNSHRTGKERELIAFNEPALRAQLNVVHGGGEAHIDYRLPRQGRREVRVNGLPISRRSELIGQVPCVLFSPEDLQLVKGAPDRRRRYMDAELSQIKPMYLYALARYTRALRQRNALLKQRDRHTLPEWEAQLSEHGSAICRMRRAFIAELEPIVAEYHAQMSDGQECVSLGYSSDAALEDAAVFLRLLTASREADMMRGTTSVGPHRDDLYIALNELDVRNYGSQGQQRTATLALKLSEVAWMRRQIREAPLLLLDDVLSELDERRQERLLHAVRGVHTVVTSTHAIAIPGSIVMRVRAGQILCES